MVNQISKHHFAAMIRELDSSILYKGVSDLETWMSRVEDLADRPDTIIRFPESGRKKFLGDAFEHFVECVINHYGENPKVNCVNVHPTQQDESGVDLVGEAHDMSVHTIQCKYRSDTKALLSNSKDGIAMFPAVSLTSYDAKHMTVWTTGYALHPITDHAFEGKVNVINYNQIRKLVDKDDRFWDFYESDLIQRGNISIDDEIGSLDAGFVLRNYQMRGYSKFTKIYADSPSFSISGVSQGVNEMKGRFVYPTGAGKTAIQCTILKDMMEKGGNGVHIVLAPRIILVKQLMREYRNYLGRSRHIAVAFHSGKSNTNYDSVSWKEETTTEPTEIEAQISRACSSEWKKDLVIFCTYNSLPKLVDHGFVFDTMIADESQYCIRKKNFKNIWNAKAAVKLFFTATERHGIGDRSNSNKYVFGEIIDQESVTSLIRSNRLVRPALHIVFGTRMEAGKDSIVDEAKHIARYQRGQVHSEMKTKTIFSCRKTDDVKAIVENLDSFREDMPDHDIFTIISDKEYEARVNGEIRRREVFLEMLRECNKNAMIFHYDILSEGLDIDGITGCAIMREMGQSKITQTIGRSVRPYKANPDFKKRALVSVPVIDDDDESMVRVKNIILKMRECGLDLNVEPIMVSDINEDTKGSRGRRNRGTKKDTDKQDTDQGELDLRAQTLIDVIEHKIEDEFRKDHLRALNSLEDSTLMDMLQNRVMAASSNSESSSATIHGMISDGSHDVEEDIREMLHIFTRRSRGHNIPMPFELAEEIVERVEKELYNLESEDMDGSIWSSKKIAVLYNMEFVHALFRNCNVNKDNITYFGDCPNKEEIMKTYGCKCKRVVELRDWKDNEFDVVLANPPYQAQNPNDPDGFQPKSHSQWKKFLELFFTLAKEGGMIGAVTPGSWKSPSSLKKFTSQQLVYADLDCSHHFQEASSFTWWVAENRGIYKGSILKTGPKNEIFLDLRKIKYIPINPDKTLSIHEKVMGGGGAGMSSVRGGYYHKPLQFASRC